MAALALAAWMLPAVLLAQDSPDDAPLGDVARNLRKKGPSQEVIDNDNLSKVMDDVEGHRLSGSSLRYSFDKLGKTFQVSLPDATCSLSFSVNAKALLSSQYVQAELPASEMLKLEGPATITGDTLQVSLFNGTGWHVSELAVALTIVKRAAQLPATTAYYGSAKLLPVVASDPLESPRNLETHGTGAQEMQPPDAQGNFEKKSDVTMLYHIRAAAPPAGTTIFSTPLNIDVAPDQEWHWAIVQAKGYPPQPSTEQTSLQPPPIQPLAEPPVPAAIPAANPPSASSQAESTTQGQDQPRR